MPPCSIASRFCAGGKTRENKSAIKPLATNPAPKKSNEVTDSFVESPVIKQKTMPTAADLSVGRKISTYDKGVNARRPMNPPQKNASEEMKTNASPVWSLGLGTAGRG